MSSQIKLLILSSEAQCDDGESNLSEDEFCKEDERADGGQKLEDDQEDDEVRAIVFIKQPKFMRHWYPDGSQQQSKLLLRTWCVWST